MSDSVPTSFGVTSTGGYGATLGLAPQGQMVARSTGGVFIKLINVRVELQSMPIQKSGHNKFAGYTYFELGDFLPTIQMLFEKHGLVDVIQFTKDYATMTIYDVHDGSCVQFTSPMADAQLKGCHPIQNLGAVETYQRRYLYVTALGIVEHDALDSLTGSKQGEPEPRKKQEPAPVTAQSMSEDEQMMFVSGLIELGAASTSLSTLSTLWKQNQSQIDFVKRNNPALFNELQEQFKNLKSNFQKDSV